MSIFDSRLKYVQCKIWRTAESRLFPEMDDAEVAMDRLTSTPNTGVAFSGGGTRAAAAALGQIRGLSALGLLSTIRYFSSVSGGAWTCIPFAYVPALVPEDTFLGQVVDPAKLTIEHLDDLDRNSFAYAISNSGLFDRFLENALRLAGDETYSRALGDIFLLPFGIDSLERFFTATDKSLNAILGRNPKMTGEDFYLLRPNRPFPIAGGTILRPDNEPPLPRRIHFEMTPLYAGAFVLHPGAGSRGRDIGGGYVEPFGFDSDAPDRKPKMDVVTVRLGAMHHRFTLSDVIGTTGAAPAEVLAQAGLDWLGFPEFKYWPPVDRPTEVEYTFGDGGILENMGIMPLLMRKVERIVVFVNSNHALKTGRATDIADSVPPVFGQTPEFMTNHVFPQDRFQPLLEAFWKSKEEGKTVLHRDAYPVLENKHYGIEGGWTVEVLWVYNERVAEWEEALPAATRSLIGRGSLGNFPHYKTFFQNVPSIIDLNARQTAMLGHLSCWNVTANANVFQSMLG